MDETPIELSAIVGGRGNQLDIVRGGSCHGSVEEQVTGDLGRPVRGSNGIVGWMHDNEAANKKVSGITYVVSCYVICFFAGIYLAITSYFVTISSVNIFNRYPSIILENRVP